MILQRRMGNLCANEREKKEKEALKRKLGELEDAKQRLEKVWQG